MAYPTKGIELIVPSSAELPFTGWGANFARRGHEYAVRYHPAGLLIKRDGRLVARWDDLPAMVQKLIVKTRGTYAATFAKAMEGLSDDGRRDCARDCVG